MFVLPTILLGIRSSIKEDIGCSSAELVYGSPLRLPGEFFDKTSPGTSENEFHLRLRSTIQSLQPVPASHHIKERSFVHKDLQSCTHVFVRNDMVRKPLQPPFEGPYKVLKRHNKHFTVQLPRREAVISIDRLKPAFLCNEEKEVTSNTSTRSPSAKPVEKRPGSQLDEVSVTTRSGRRVVFPKRYTDIVDTGEGVM